MPATTLKLPAPDGSLRPHVLGEPRAWPRPSAPLRERTAYAAAHVVADPLADNTPGQPACIDWDGTLAFRRHLWSHGLGVADAMDTAQRGMGLTWEATEELIHRSSAEASACGGAIAVGVGTDHAPSDPDGLQVVLDAYLHQLEVAEEAGATPILMASRQLARVARGADDYAKVYGRLLEETSRPAILHWLGEMFDPALTGYWGSEDVAQATANVLAIIVEHADRVEGIKVSLLDTAHEVGLRRALPGGVRMYTGDDFNYPELILGDEHGASHALLGIFDPIAPAASAALQALDDGDTENYRALLTPTVPLARHLFAPPTFYYKTGIVFLAWLAGHQDAFTMVGGLQSARSVLHLAEAFRLADAAGLLPDAELAADRMRRFLAVAGLEA